jgi:ribosomal protein S18 acetylase RimI-like enzyme
LIETALAAGGRDVAWIVADDEGRARELYERLGFETVWRPHSFVRRPLS